MKASEKKYLVISIVVALGLVLIMQVFKQRYVLQDKEPYSKQKFIEGVKSGEFEELTDQEKKKILNSLEISFAKKNIDRYASLSSEEKRIFISNFLDYALAKDPSGNIVLGILEPTQMQKKLSLLNGDSRKSLEEFYTSLKTQFNNRRKQENFK